MIYITDEIIENIIKEDVPFSDITTDILDIASKKGQLTFYARENGLIAGSSVAAKIFKKLGAQVVYEINEGSSILKDEKILQVKASADILHTGWKVSLNTLEYLSGIATYSNKMVTKARNINENIMLAATRKSLPLSKQLVTLGFLAGGVVPHRLGLSETILIFKQHLEFLGGIDNLEKTIKHSKNKTYEKKIILETENYENSIKALHYDFIDGLQVDKLAPNIIKDIVNERNKTNKHIVIIAAGGINLSNIEDYANTGAEVIVSSSFFHASPLDIKALMEMED